MKKNKNPLLILFFIIWSGTLYYGMAQNSGYRGKKLSIGYNFFVSTALFNSSNNGTSIFNTGGSSERSIFSFNTMHILHIDYAILRRWSIGAYYSYLHTSYDGKHELYYSGSTVNTKPVNTYDIKVNGIGLNIKLFGEAYIAPLGNYIKLDILLKSITSTYDPKIFYIETTPYAGYVRSNFGNTKQTYIKPEFFFSFGKQRIYFNHIILDLGVRASSNIILLPVRFIFKNHNEESLYEETEYIKTTSIRRVRSANMLNYYAGISFLIF